MTTSLRLARVLRRRFGQGRRFRPELSEFLVDVARLYDVPARIDDTTPRTCFTEMVHEVLPELSAAGQQVDLALVAHATPDAEPGWPGIALSGGLPGNPAACGIADQGTAAPFTALRVVDAHARSATVDSAVVVIPDQHTVVGAPVAAGADGLVALVLDRHGEFGVPVVRQWTSVTPDKIGATVTASWPTVPASDVPTTVVLGPGIADHWTPPDGIAVVHATTGLPSGGTWHAVAARLPSWQRGHRVLVADFEAETGELSTCWLDVPGSPP